MLKYNEVANNINILVSNYKYLFNKLMSIDYLIVSWIQLTTGFFSFFEIKHKWFKFFTKTVLTLKVSNKNKICAMSLNKFEQKIVKIYIFKAQVIKNSSISAINSFFKGILKKSKIKKNQKKYLKHWIVKPIFKSNFLLNKFDHFIVRIKKLDLNVSWFLTFKIEKLFSFNWLNCLKCPNLKDFYCLHIYYKKFFHLNFITKHGILFENNLSNIFILDCFLVFLDNFIFDLLAISSINISYMRHWDECFINFKNQSLMLLISNLLTNFIQFKLFLNPIKKKKLNIRKKYLNFFNYFFLISNLNFKIKHLSNKTQSVKRYKHRSLALANQKTKKLYKIQLYKLQNKVKNINSSPKLNSFLYSFLKNRHFKQLITSFKGPIFNNLAFNMRHQFFDVKQFSGKKLKAFKKLTFDFKTAVESFEFKSSNLISKTKSLYLRRQKKQKRSFCLSVFAPIKNISKNLQFFGFLSYKKNNFCVNKIISFDNYNDIIKLYSIIIIKLLLYYQMVHNLDALKSLCLSIRKSCLLTVKLQYRNSKNHFQIFQRYYSFIKSKFVDKWTKLTSINLIKKYKCKLLLNRLVLNFNISYIVWKFKTKNYFYNFI